MPFYFYAVFFSLIALSLSTRAGLLINPTRLVFNEANKIAQIDIVNTGPETEIYRLRLVNRYMDVNGQLIVAEHSLPQDQFATNLIFFSPRQVTLLPYTAQLIRIAIRKPKDLMPGEYRSHLLFERIASHSGQLSITNLNKKRLNEQSSKEIQIDLMTLVNATIPIIIHHGNTYSEVEINDLAIVAEKEKTRKTLTFKLIRRGNCSIYGTLVLKFISETGQINHIDSREGIAIYTSNPYRIIQFDLSNIRLEKGKLIASYFSVNRDQAPLAEAELIFP